MSQISPPIRIVLVAAVAFLAAWMLFLRPKTEEIPPPAPAATAPAKQPGTTAQSAAGKAVQAAENAKATAESAAKARAGETAAPTAPATKAPAAQPAAKAAATKLDVDPAALDTLPLGVRNALEARKIVVLGFFNRAALDDRLTKKQLKRVHRFHGRVYVHAAALKAVQRYQVITRGVDVSQTPSIVVIDRNMKAQLLSGYVDHVRVEQAIVDAMRRSDMAVVKAPYLRKVNALCGTYVGNLYIALEPGENSDLRSWVRDNSKQVDRFAARFSALKAPKAYKAFKKQWLGYLTLASQADHAILAAVKAKSLTRLDAAVAKYSKPLAKGGKGLTKSSRQHDMLACMYG